MLSHGSHDGIQGSEHMLPEFEVGDDTYQVRRPVMAPRRPDYSVTVDRTGGKPLGITYDYSDGARVVIKDMQPGLLYDWNRTAEQDSWVLLEDSIVAANGVEGDVDLVIQECLKHDLLHLKMRPPDVDPEVPPVCLTRDPRVLVHVYDLVEGAAVKWLNNHWPRRGFFHTGVEVYGREWFFCGTEGAFHGVYSVTPRCNPRHVYRKSVLMGHTMLDPGDFADLVPMIRMRWPGWTYHVTQRNCHAFTTSSAGCSASPPGQPSGSSLAGTPRTRWASRGAASAASERPARRRPRRARTRRAPEAAPLNGGRRRPAPTRRTIEQNPSPPPMATGPRRDGPEQALSDPAAVPPQHGPGRRGVADPAAGPGRRGPELGAAVAEPSAGPCGDRAEQATI
ncbi:unnamed protein product [Prorocentrum cordatum]|uniref:PPPDE domain-containing protein n=1 Tax=Prorocentrum cordatum TaxID=2364126 RepID=A0ABN9QKW9_9DINO|nr:unnamed protein product [Polarella glacialis]